MHVCALLRRTKLKRQKEEGMGLLAENTNVAAAVQHLLSLHSSPPKPIPILRFQSSAFSAAASPQHRLQHRNLLLDFEVRRVIAAVSELYASGVQ